MEEKRPPGRPPKGDEPRSERINLRAQPSEKTLFEEAARKAEVSMTDWIMDRLTRAARRELKR